MVRNSGVIFLFFIALMLPLSAEFYTVGAGTSLLDQRDDATTGSGNARWLGHANTSFRLINYPLIYAVFAAGSGSSTFARAGMYIETTCRFNCLVKPGKILNAPRQGTITVILLNILTF